MILLCCRKPPFVCLWRTGLLPRVGGISKTDLHQRTSMHHACNNIGMVPTSCIYTSNLFDELKYAMIMFGFYAIIIVVTKMICVQLSTQVFLLEFDINYWWPAYFSLIISCCIILCLSMNP